MHELKTNNISNNNNNNSSTWQDSLTQEIMKIGQQLQRQTGGETSSGYGSRESLADGLLNTTTPPAHDGGEQLKSDDAVISKQLNNINLNNNTNNNINNNNNNLNNIDNISNTCSCRRSTPGSTTSSRHSGCCSSSRHSAGSSRHSTGSRKSSSSKLSSVSHTTQQLVLHENDRLITSPRRHSRNKHHESSASTISNTRSNRVGDSAEVNIENVSQYIDGLVQQNLTLAQELKTSRKFFEGTFSEMSAELSSAQMKIKILEETVNTYQENQKKLTSEGRSSIRRRRNNTRTHTVGTQTSSDSHTHSLRPTTPILPIIGVRKNRSPDVNNDQPKQTPETPEKTANRTEPIIRDRPADDMKRFEKLLLSEKFSLKGRELLAEKNQQLRDDIARLKHSMRNPPPSPLPEVESDEPATPSPRDENEDDNQSDDENDPMTSQQEEQEEQTKYVEQQEQQEDSQKPQKQEEQEEQVEQEEQNEEPQKTERSEKKASHDSSPLVSPRNKTSSKRQRFKEERKYKKEAPKKEAPKKEGKKENNEQDTSSAPLPTSLISHRDGASMLKDHKDRLIAEYRQPIPTDSPIQSPRRKRSSSKTRSSTNARNSRVLTSEETISSDEVRTSVDVAR